MPAACVSLLSHSFSSWALQTVVQLCLRHSILSVSTPYVMAEKPISNLGNTSTAQDSTARPSTAQHSTARPSTARHGTAQHTQRLTRKAGEVERGCETGTSALPFCIMAVTKGSINSGGTGGIVMPKSPMQVLPMVFAKAMEPIPVVARPSVLPKNADPMLVFVRPSVCCSSSGPVWVFVRPSVCRKKSAPMLVFVRPSVCRRKSGAVTVVVRLSACCGMSGDMFVDVRAKPFPADGESGLVRSQLLPGVLGSADSRLPFVGRTSCGGPSLLAPAPSAVRAPNLLLVCLAGPRQRISHN